MLPLQLAWRFMTEGRTQTMLILAGVTIGVAAYVFITATMAGVQQNLLDKTLGAQAHLSVLNEDAPPEPIFSSDSDRLILRQVVLPEPRRRPFDQWQLALTRMEATPGVTAACPTLAGAGLAVRGGSELAIEIVGADPTRLATIIDLPGNMVAGDYRPGSEQVVIGQGLANDLGIGVGSPLRLRTQTTDAQVRVVGLFNLGSDAVDSRWVVMSLRGAQSILGQPGDISRIDGTVEQIFSVDDVAARVRKSTGRDVESWIDRNGSLLTALSAQDQSTLLIRAFTLLAVAMGIASVLGVSVVQRRGQIGILRAMGVRARVVLMVFLWQGALLGIGGAILGTGVGALVGFGLAQVVPFNIVVDLQTAITATLISLATGLLAALWPARTAALMDPAAAIRGDG
ncbi:MAG: ABC transporter permease [Myxococcota bacterium]